MAACLIVMSAFPKLSWNLYKLRFRYVIDTDSLTPPDGYVLSANISLIVLTAAVLLIALYIILTAAGWVISY